MTPQSFFFITLATGGILLGAEVFAPGGVLGAIAAVALVAAIILGFFAFPGYGVLIAIAVLAVSLTSVFLWIKLWPRSRLGKQMFVRNDLSLSKSSEAVADLEVGNEGVADTMLRPSGYAIFGANRIDVVSDGDMIERGESVKVIEIKGSRVVVVKVS